ncbi:hypothetical protein, partial [Burkholderia gladioli]|uniref:hypothetical protein n=1 Tax=Burkholderia gladioli TaxID=28095 RepID=UPI001C3F2A32
MSSTFIPILELIDAKHSLDLDRSPAYTRSHPAAEQGAPAPPHRVTAAFAAAREASRPARPAR